MQPPDLPRVPILEVRRLSKAFGGVQALREVSFAICRSTIHALVGENGAGKSTLMKILAGHFPADDGELRFAGRAVRWRHPHDALEHGIAMIHQELLGFPRLTVAENVFMGCEPASPFLGWVDRRRRARDTANLLGRLGVPLSPARRLDELSTAQRQAVEIARALAHRARLLIMDEPTSALSALEVHALFAVIRELRQAGVTILYVSHRLEEVLALADDLTVLRDGRRMLTAPAQEFDTDRLISLMAGGKPSIGGQHSNQARGAVVLEVQRLAAADKFQEISFRLHSGEVLGLAGLMGAGRTAVAEAIYGLAPAGSGAMRLGGKPYAPRQPAEALARGVAMVTEDRQGSGLIPELSLQQNLTLASLAQFCRGPFIRRNQEAAAAITEIRRFGIKASGPNQPILALSGGNQQKVLLARALLASPRVLILDEPTRGIDVAAKAEIHGLIRHLAVAGLGVLLISSELEELLALCDRLIVLREGEVTAEFEARGATPEQVLAFAMPA